MAMEQSANLFYDMASMFTTTTTEQQRLSKPFHKPVPNY